MKAKNVKKINGTLKTYVDPKTAIPCFLVFERRSIINKKFGPILYLDNTWQSVVIIYHLALCKYNFLLI